MTTDRSSVLVSIGEIRVELASVDSGMTVAVAEGTKRFVVGEGVADAQVSASWGDLSRPVDGPEIFDSGSQWKLYRQGEDYVFRFTIPLTGEHAFKEARFSSDFTSGHVTLHADYHDPSLPAVPLRYPLDELLFTNLLGRGRGVEVHACGLRDHDGRGYLFTGHSQVGKSTTARIWEKEGVLILSDDRIILRWLDGKLWMYGTPWHGEGQYAAADRTELTHVFVLGQGDRNELVPLAPAEAVSSLFTRSFVPFYNGAALAYTLDVLQQVALVVPCAELRFVPDAKVVEFVRENAK